MPRSNVERRPLTAEERGWWGSNPIADLLPLEWPDKEFTLTRYRPQCVSCAEEVTDPQMVRGIVVDLLPAVKALKTVCYCEPCKLLTVNSVRIRLEDGQTRMEFLDREGEWKKKEFRWQWCWDNVFRAVWRTVRLWKK
jgi:hypothetical protein